MSAERLAMAVTDSDLTAKDDRIRSVEHVASLAGASGLGSDIFRAKDCDLAAARRAVLLLTKKAIKAGLSSKLPISRAIAQAMAAAVLAEIAMPQCRTCMGASVKIIDSLKLTCPDCEGTGMHRYTDKERAQLCGISKADWPKWEKRYLLVLAEARGHDCAPIKARERLG